MATFKFVTKDMVPETWHLPPEQEGEWLADAARGLSVAEGTLQRLVTVELPDTHTAWAYQRAYLRAAERRDDLVTPVITSREQWDGRLDQLARVVQCLWEGEPPAVAFCAIAVKM